MKKVLISLCMAIVCLCASAQQKGDMGVGLNIGVVPCIESGDAPTNFDLGAKFRYSFSDAVRFEADLNYGFENKLISVFDITANIHYMIPVASKFYLYPLAGLGYGNLHLNLDDFGLKGENESRFAFNVGLGAEYFVTSALSFDFEFKYQYMKDFGRLPILLGINYHF